MIALLLLLVGFIGGAYFMWSSLRYADRLRTKEEVEAHRRQVNHELGD